MTREEEIKNKATAFADFLSDGLYYHSQQHKCREHGFIQGAEWADQHPRKGLWDAEKVCKYLENHAGHYMTLENDEEGELQSVFYQKGLIEDLRKAMEE